MKTLITGGAGFIGSAVIPELKKYGYYLKVIDNLSFGKREFVDVDDVDFYKVDILDGEKLNEIVSSFQPECIVHLAAVHFIPYCNEHPFESSNINIHGTINVLEAAKKSKALKKVLFASTAAVYPISDDPVSEKLAPNPLDIYGLSKWTGEKLFHDFYQETNIDTLICRFFNAFGPNETNPHLIPEIEQQVKSGKRTLSLGNLDPKRDFIHTYDMARAVKALIEIQNTGYETFNLGRGIEYSVREIVQAFERQLGEELKIEQEPSRIRKTERMHLLADVSKLKQKTGWEPEWSIDEGIKNLLEN